MPPENPRNFIAAKEISVFVSLSPSAYLACVIRFRLEHR
jgi:hypothetical protein